MPLTRPDIEDNATRRRFLQMIGAAGLLAGYASGDDAASASSLTATSATRSFAHGLGTTRIPTAPRRVVTLTVTAALNAAALGRPPVASLLPTNLDVLGDLASLLAGVTFVGPENQPNFETILAVRPDASTASRPSSPAPAGGPDLVILYAEDGVGYPEGAYEKLSPVVPTVGLEFPWRDYATATADVIGAQGRLAELFAERDRRVAEIATRARDVGPVATVRVSDNAGGIITPINPNAAELVHEELGFSAPDLGGLGGPGVGGLQADGYGTDLSAERIGLEAAESLLVAVMPDAPADSLEKIEANPLWARLPAVQAGRVYTTSMLVLDPDSLPQQMAALDFIEQSLLSAVASPSASPAPTG